MDEKLIHKGKFLSYYISLSIAALAIINSIQSLFIPKSASILTIIMFSLLLFACYFFMQGKEVGKYTLIAFLAIRFLILSIQIIILIVILIMLSAKGISFPKSFIDMLNSTNVLSNPVPTIISYLKLILLIINFIVLISSKSIKKYIEDKKNTPIKINIFLFIFIIITAMLFINYFL